MQLKVLQRKEATFDGASCLVIPLFQGAEPNFGSSPSKEEAEALRALSDRGVITGKEEEVTYLPTPKGPHAGIATLGLGKYESFDAEVLRRAAGSACGTFKEQRITHAVLDGTSDDALPVEAFIEGIQLGQYTFDTYKKEADVAPAIVEAITILTESSESLDDLRAGCERALLTCENTNWARDLANTPANDLTPSALAGHAETMAAEVGCACTVLGEDAMRELGMNALLSVSKGSHEEAKLIVLHYTHPEASTTLAIVGKGITFDSGGISIKPGEGMHEMKFDMCGAAAVLGAMKTVCQLKPEVNLLCVVPAAENKPGTDASRPGDVVRAFNGKTIEIHNTDAEGRLILADALAYTIETYKPDAIVNTATLTGACIAALGHYAAGLMSTDDDLAAALHLAAHASGERVWSLPLWKEYSRLIEGTHADLCNIGPKGEAGTVTAGCFLKEFVGDTPWAHVDIAGTAWGGKHIPYLDAKHATGFGVRLLTQWILNEAR